MVSELTFEITQYCEHYCEYCSSNSTTEGKHLKFEEVEAQYDKWSENHGIPQIINISGGEPLSNPDFYKILMFFKMKCKYVRVYTNALDWIVFNSDVLDGITIDANVCLRPGKINIPRGQINKIKLLKLVNQGRAKKMMFNKLPEITLSGDNCKYCDHKVFQADGKIADAPCRKNYEE